jgi:hypothetical protein
VGKESKNTETQKTPLVKVFGTIANPGSPDEVFLAKIEKDGLITEWKPQDKEEEISENP